MPDLLPDAAFVTVTLVGFVACGLLARFLWRV